jgi:hypothetical protein
MVSLFKNDVVGVDLRPGSIEELDTIHANLGWLSRVGDVSFQKGSDVGKEFAQRDTLVVYPVAEATT